MDPTPGPGYRGEFGTIVTVFRQATTCTELVCLLALTGFGTLADSFGQVSAATLITVASRSGLKGLLWRSTFSESY